MRILQILPSLDDGGVERGTVDSNRLYLAAGHEGWVISAGGKRVAEIERDGGHHVTVDVKSKNPLTAYFRMRSLRKALRQIRPDVIHFRSRVPGWLTLWANRAKDLRIPTVSTLHGLNHPCFYSSVMMRADKVIAVSSVGKTFIETHYPWVRQECIQVIPRGVEVDYFSPKAIDTAWIEAFKKEHHLEGKFIATAIGRVSALKGIDTLVSAIALLKTRMPNAVALVVGGPQKHQEHVFDDLRAQAVALGVEDRVLLVGSQKKIPEIAALSSVVCSCNVRKPESFGRTVAEALAMETPVIAAAHGGVLDIIRDGQDGILYPPGDAEALANAIEKVAATTYTGLRQHILDCFTAERMATETMAVYEKLLAHQ
jgi:glycosyltransferase involved in cell wall biosynthesis